MSAIEGVDSAGRNNRPHRMKSAMRYFPGFVVILIAYAILKSLEIDLREIQFNVSGFAITVVEILYLAAFFVGMIEILKVSYPGESNLYEAIAMGAISVVYIVFFVLGVAKVDGFGMFRSTEFLMLMLMSIILFVIALILNNRTMGKTITDVRN
jgi:hypothetical protein